MEKIFSCTKVASITKCKHSFFHRNSFPVNPNNPINPGSDIFFLNLMQSHRHFIGLYKIAPVTIFFTTANVKLTVLNFFPNLDDLLSNCFNIGRSYYDLFFAIFFFLVGFYKPSGCLSFGPLILSLALSTLPVL